MTLGQGVGVLPVAGVDEALAGRAVEGAVVGVADLLEAEDKLAQALGRAAERIDVALGRGRGAAVCGAEPGPSATFWLKGV